MIDTGTAQSLSRLLQPVMTPLFNLNGACGTALAMGLIGGYPVGARTAVSLYEKRLCTKAEAQRMLAFCNNAGPAFIFGFVGMGVFASSRIGLLLYLTHIAASITVGVVFRQYGRRGEQCTPMQITDRTGKHCSPLQNFPNAFINAVTQAMQSVLNICAFVIFFTVFVRMLFVFGILPFVANVLSLFGMQTTIGYSLFAGLVEITGGLRNLQGDAMSSVTLAAFLLGWAGLSVHTQVLSFLSHSNLGIWTYIAGKALHAVISAAYMFIALRIASHDTTTMSIVSQQVQILANLYFYQAFIVSMQIASITLLALMLLRLAFRRSERG